MGTFHQGKGDLHGITVVVDTTGRCVFVGRCDTVSYQTPRAFKKSCTFMIITSGEPAARATRN